MTLSRSLVYDGSNIDKNNNTFSEPGARPYYYHYGNESTWLGSDSLNRHPPSPLATAVVEARAPPILSPPAKHPPSTHLGF